MKESDLKRTASHFSEFWNLFTSIPFIGTLQLIWLRLYFVVLYIFGIIILTNNINLCPNCQEVLVEVGLSLESISIPLHTLICTMIGMDKLYFIHLICSGIFLIVGSIVKVMKFEWCLLKFFKCFNMFIMAIVYLIYHFPTRIIYVATFRVATTTTEVDSKLLFRKIFLYWFLVFCFILIGSTYSIVMASMYSKVTKNLTMRMAMVLIELKMYLALLPETNKFSYIFSNNTLWIERYFIFSIGLIAFEILFDILSLHNVTNSSYILAWYKLMIEILVVFRWVFLWFYAKEKLKAFIFECLDGVYDKIKSWNWQKFSVGDMEQYESDSTVLLIKNAEWKSLEASKEIASWLMEESSEGQIVVNE